MSPAEDRDTIERFTERYRVSASEATRRIERAVIGGDWGANGYTTMTQADRLRLELDLGPESSLLDLGAGRGWPGLYLASVTGCRVVLADVPIEGAGRQVDPTRSSSRRLGDRVSCAWLYGGGEHAGRFSSPRRCLAVITRFDSVVRQASHRHPAR